MTILGLDLPSTYLASDLAWRLNDSVELNERRDGGCSMVVEVSGSLGRTLSLIRDWTTASGLGSVESRSTARFTSSSATPRPCRRRSGLAQPVGERLVERLGRRDRLEA